MIVLDTDTDSGGGTVEAQTETVVQHVDDLSILSDRNYEQAIEFLRAIKALRKRVEDAYGPLVTQAHRAHKEAVAVRKRQDEPLAISEQCLKGKIAAWREKQETEERAARATRERQARETAEAVRESQVEVLRASGDVAQADALSCEPLTLPPVVLRDSVPEVDGLQYRTRWTATVTDMNALIQQCAAEPKWQRVLSVNKSELKKLATALRDNLDLAGVTVKSTKDVAVVATRKDNEEWGV